MTHRSSVLVLVVVAVLSGRAAWADTLKFGNEGTYPRSASSPPTAG